MGTRPVAALILAAGKGTRMKSELPKTLHAVCGVPMADLVGRAVREAGVERRIMVIGHGGELLQKALGDSYEYVWQLEQKGTGHAALMGAELLASFDGTLLVTTGDTPLLTGASLADLISAHEASGAAATIGTVEFDDPSGYGRVLRGPSGEVLEIVEHRDANAEQRQCREINSGIYCFNCKMLFEELPKLKADNDQGEYYLPDVVRSFRARGERVEAHLFNDPHVMLGVNDRWQLAEASAILRKRVLRELALSGVTIIDPENTYVGVDVRVGQDTILEPMTILEGTTTIGSNCKIGPAARIVDSTIGNGCTVNASQVHRATLLDGVRCGPYANLRPGALVGVQAKIGNFVELKNASLGTKASVSHLSYIGDGSVGDGANIGAGTIFCNYDGIDKHRTEVGDGAFVGSNTTLVAPVKIGEGAIVAAGSVITSDVPENALALGRSRQEVKEAWASKWRDKKKKDA